MFPCQHIWQFHLMSDEITSHDWLVLTTTKTYTIKEIRSVTGGPWEHMLGLREVLDDTKIEARRGFTPEQNINILCGFKI